MPRFVILHHETPAGYSRETHFDLMLEQNGALRTWALEKIPATDEVVMAERLADHRLSYLEFEGEITGDRGRVTRFAAGQYEIVSETDDTLIVQLRGNQLTGKLTLSRDDKKTHLWRVSFAPG
jgi:hypothetical protein